MSAPEDPSFRGRALREFLRDQTEETLAPPPVAPTPTPLPPEPRVRVSPPPQEMRLPSPPEEPPERPLPVPSERRRPDELAPPVERRRGMIDWKPRPQRRFVQDPEQEIFKRFELLPGVTVKGLHPEFANPVLFGGIEKTWQQFGLGKAVVTSGTDRAPGWRASDSRQTRHPTGDAMDLRLRNDLLGPKVRHYLQEQLGPDYQVIYHYEKGPLADPKIPPHIHVELETPAARRRTRQYYSQMRKQRRKIELRAE